MTLYRSTETEDRLFDYISSLEHTTVDLDVLKENVEEIIKGEITCHPYDKHDRELRVFWENSTFYHGAYIKCEPHKDNDRIYDVSEVKWYTEVDKNPIYF